MIFIYISTFWHENSLHKYAKLPISRLVCARWADITTKQNSLTICFFWGERIPEIINPRDNLNVNAPELRR